MSDILTAIRRFQGFPIPDREAFLASDVLQDAVVRNLEIIGEATKRLSDTCRQQHPLIPVGRWQGCGMC
nr:HepT-like ribonuclease domain-containing protein [Synechococcus sp. RedBA-s]